MTKTDIRNRPPYRTLIRKSPFLPSRPTGLRGMAYKPYSDELPVAPGVPVNLLVVGDDERAAQELAVAANEAWIWDFVQYGRPVMLDVNVRSCYFPNHTDIHTAQTGNETSFNPEHKACDVVVAGFETTKMAVAQRYMRQAGRSLRGVPVGWWYPAVRTTTSSVSMPGGCAYVSEASTGKKTCCRFSGMGGGR